MSRYKRVPSRIAPSGGYEFKGKRVFRNDIWSELAKHSAKGCSVLMPSIEGREILTASAQGFPRSRMIAVDYNAAIAATCVRRFGISRGMGCSISKAFQRLGGESVHVDACSLDFTGNVGSRLLDELLTIGDSAAFAKRGPTSLAINLLRGREGPWFTPVSESVGDLRADLGLPDTIAPQDAVRIALALFAGGLVFDLHKAGRYVSTNGQSFLFAVATFYPHLRVFPAKIAKLTSEARFAEAKRSQALQSQMEILRNRMLSYHAAVRVWKAVWSQLPAFIDRCSFSMVEGWFRYCEVTNSRLSSALQAQVDE